MSTVTMGLANQENVTITMFNTVEEDLFLEEAKPKNIISAKYGMARKRLFNDTHLEVNDKGKTIYTPNCAEAVVFPISA